MSKDAIIHLLLSIYPRAWRSEYGGELAAILAGRPLTLSIIADVVLCGVWQRFRYAKVWLVGGTALALWLIIGTAINSVSPLSRSAYNGFFEMNWMAELAIGYICVSRYSRGPAAAALTAAKASLIGIIPELLLAALWATNVIHPAILDMNGSPHIHGHGITDLCQRTEGTASPVTLFIGVPITTVIPAFLFGFTGAAVARGVSMTRRLFGAQK